MMGNLQDWHCPTCKRVLRISGIFVGNDEKGTSTIMYDCPVCGKTDIRNRLDSVIVLTEELPKKTFMGRVQHMIDLAEKTNTILSKMENRPILKLVSN